MFGTNSIKTQDLSNPDNLYLEDVFLTIQGEGPLTGKPAIFLRFSGCNLACQFCDTEFETYALNYNVQQIIDCINHINTVKTNLIIITGGEPLLYNLSNLIDQLLDNGFVIQIETNATLYQKLPVTSSLIIVCSPKTPQINQQLAPRIDYYKYIVSSKFINKNDGLPDYNSQNLDSTACLARPPKNFDRSRIYLLPMDEYDITQNELNIKVAVESCLKFGYNLSLQIHKYAKIK